MDMENQVPHEPKGDESVRDPSAVDDNRRVSSKGEYDENYDKEATTNPDVAGTNNVADIKSSSSSPLFNNGESSNETPTVDYRTGKEKDEAVEKWELMNETPGPDDGTTILNENTTRPPDNQ